CTNKVHASAMQATEKLGIQPLFDVISGADTWSAAKPSPIPLLETLRMLELEAQECLYFGDTSVDAACAQQAGVRFVLHEAGYGDPVLRRFPRHFAFSNWN